MGDSTVWSSEYTRLLHSMMDVDQVSLHIRVRKKKELCPVVGAFNT